MYLMLGVLTLFCTVIAFVICGSAQVSQASVPQGRSESGVADSEAKKHLTELNRQLWEEYMMRHNTEPYEKLALPEYLLLANIGLVETKEQVIATAGNLKIEAIQVVAEEFRLYENTAILVGKLEVNGNVLGHPLPPRMRYMSVFVKSNGEWRVMAQSLTQVIDPRELQK